MKIYYFLFLKGKMGLNRSKKNLKIEIVNPSTKNKNLDGLAPKDLSLFVTTFSYKVTFFSSFFGPFKCILALKKITFQPTF